MNVCRGRAWIGRSQEVTRWQVWWSAPWREASARFDQEAGAFFTARRRPHGSPRTTSDLQSKLRLSNPRSPTTVSAFAAVSYFFYRGKRTTRNLTSANSEHRTQKEWFHSSKLSTLWHFVYILETSLFYKSKCDPTTGRFRTVFAVSRSISIWETISKRDKNIRGIYYPPQNRHTVFLKIFTVQTN